MKIRRKNNFLILLVLVTFSCTENATKKEKRNESKNDFENIFSSKEYSDYDKTTYEEILNTYQDSIKIISGKIENDIPKIENISDRDSFIKLMKDDSLLFYKNLDAQTNMIYYSYNGFSEGIDGEKSIYTNLYYLNHIKNHLKLLKGINYNLQKNLKH